MGGYIQSKRSFSSGQTNMSLFILNSKKNYAMKYFL